MGQGDRLVYGSEGNSPVAPQLAQFAKDIEKPQVVALFKQMLDTPRILLRYNRDLIRLLDILAPRSKVAKLVRARWDDLYARRSAVMDLRRPLYDQMTKEGKTYAEQQAILIVTHPMPIS